MGATPIITMSGDMPCAVLAAVPKANVILKVMKINRIMPATIIIMKVISIAMMTKIIQGINIHWMDRIMLAMIIAMMTWVTKGITIPTTTRVMVTIFIAMMTILIMHRHMKHICMITGIQPLWRRGILCYPPLRWRRRR